MCVKKPSSTHNLIGSIVLKKISLVAFLSTSIAAYAAPVIINGSFNTSRPSTEWYMNTPDSWIGTGNEPTQSTPDINDIGFVMGQNDTTSGFTTVSPASHSNDGGTFVGLGAFAFAGEGPNAPEVPFVLYEGISQVVDGFEAGKTYRISWELANFGIASSIDSQPLTTGEVGISVFVDEEVVGSGKTRSVQEGWETQSITFKASSASHLIELRSINWNQSTNASYTLIDGVSLAEVITSPITATPVPGLGLLGLLGLSGVIGLFNFRHRRRG